MIRLALVVLLLSACPTGGPKIRYQTTHGIEVAGETIPAQADVERWTLEVVNAIGVAACPELANVTASAALTMLRYSADRKRAVRLLWQDPPFATGRFLQAGSGPGFKHELTHSLLDAIGVPWSEAGHHEVMKRCDVP